MIETHVKASRAPQEALIVLYFYRVLNRSLASKTLCPRRHSLEHFSGSSKFQERLSCSHWHTHAVRCHRNPGVSLKACLVAACGLVLSFHSRSSSIKLRV
jgi:hypothetical protein